MPKHGSINLYVHGNQKVRWDGQPRTSTSTLTQLLNYACHTAASELPMYIDLAGKKPAIRRRVKPGSVQCERTGLTRVLGIKQGVSTSLEGCQTRRQKQTPGQNRRPDQPTGPHTWGAYEPGLGQERKAGVARRRGGGKGRLGAGVGGGIGGWGGGGGSKQQGLGVKVCEIPYGPQIPVIIVYPPPPPPCPDITVMVVGASPPLLPTQHPFS